MNKTFLPTNNYHRMVAGVDSLVNRDESLPGLGLIYGRFGFGKSAAIEHYYSVSDIHYVVLERLWRPRRVLEEICDVLDLGTPERRLDHLSDQVKQGLRQQGKPLFIDEADYLNDTMIDTIRDIHEKTRVPIVLVGMEDLYKELAKPGRGQFFSRILPAAIVRFEAVTPPEIQLITREWTGMTIGMEAAEAMCRYVGGDFRYIVGYLLSLEEACRVNETNEITAALVEAVVGRNGGRQKARPGRR